MEKEKKSLKFIMVVAIILSMTLYDLIVIGKATVSFAEELIREKVQVSCYFKDTNGNNVNSIETTTANELYAYFDVSVNEGGYLTSGKVSLENNNFIFDKSFKSENIVSIEENAVTLNQINGGETKQIKTKIKTAKRDIYDLNLLNHKTDIKLNGVYNTDKQEDVEAKSSVQVKYISPYTSAQKNIISANVITNKIYKIREQNRRIVQLELKNSLQGNNYPIKHTKFELSVPENAIDVQVYSRGTQMTNGKEETDFVMQQYNLNRETNVLSIDLDNPIVINENGENNVSWKQNSNDDLIVTYIFEETATLPEGILTKTEINLYDEIIGDRQSTALNDEANIKIEEEKDGIIDGALKTEEDKIYKGKIYSGEDRTYNILTKVDIKYEAIESEINLEKKQNKLQLVELNKETNKNEITKEIDAKTKFKGLRVSKQDIQNILGDNGSIEIQNEEKVIVSIDKALMDKIEALNNTQGEKQAQEDNNQVQEKVLTEQDYSAKMQNNYIIINYKEQQENIKINIKNSIEQGTLNIYHEEVIKNNNIERSELKKVNRYFEEWEIKGGSQTTSKNINTNMELLDTTTMTQFRVKNNTLTAGKITEGVEIQVLLRNDDEKYDLFKNPTLKINVPKEIIDVKINDVKIVYADGLEEETRKVVKNEDGTSTIIIKLKNAQKGHQISVDGIWGTVVSVICDLQLDSSTTVNSAETTLNVKNDEDVVYDKACANKVVLNYIVPKVENKGLRSTASLTQAQQETPTNEETSSKQKTPASGETSGNQQTPTSGEMSVIKQIPVSGEGLIEQQKPANQETSGEQQKPTQQETPIQQKIKVTKSVSKGEGENIDNMNVYEREILKYTITVKNDTNQQINNITITDNIPDEATLVEYDASWGNGNGYYEKEDKKFENTITSLKANETKTLEYYVRVNKNEQNIGKYIGGTEISTEAIARIAGESIEYKSNKTTNKIVEGKIEVNLAWTRQETMFLKEDTEYKGYILKVKNLTNEELTDIQVKDYISENFTFIEACELVNIKYSLDEPNLDENGNEVKQIINSFVESEDESKKLPLSSYNEQTRTLIWNINKLEKNEEKAILIDVKTNKLRDGEYEKNIYNTADVSINNKGQTNIYKSNTILVRIIKENISVKLDVSAKETYIQEESEFEYYIKIENLGNIAKEYRLKEILPEYVIGQSLKYRTKGDVKLLSDLEILSQNTISSSVKMGVGTSLEIIVKVRAANISDEGLSKYPIENKVKFGDIESNIIKNIIIAKKSSNNKDSDTKNNESSSTGNNIISGCVWFDANKDGMRDDNENYLSGITVQLIKKSTGNFIGKKVTDSKGKYSFSNIKNGDYIIGFAYDNNIYTLTQYQKRKVSSDRNSDVILSQAIDEKGQKLGLTDIIKINNNSVKNVDMGLIKETKYNLQIKKCVESITVKSSNKTKIYRFNNSEFAKVEIPSKELESSNVTIKYKFIITNNGELPGYATEITDYLPSDLKFNEKSNSDWNRQGENLVSTTLVNKKINPGENVEIKLVLTKKMNNSNTGNIVNNVEITGVKNELGIDDNNKEDNKSAANVLISIRTGEKTLLYIAIISLSLVIIGLGIYIIKKKIL